MRRREFIALLAGATAAWPFGVRAQKRERPRRLGVLMSNAESDPLGQARLPLGISDDEAGVHLLDGSQAGSGGQARSGSSVRAIAIRGCIGCGGSSLRTGKRVGCQIAV
jgi:hypothetical protein